MKRLRVPLLVLGVALLAAACANPFADSPFYKPDRWIVTVNPMDYVQFLCGAGVTNDTGMAALKVELLGTGYLTCWQGRSPRVANEFWNQPGGRHWEEYRTDSVHLNETYVRHCFQYIVDSGLFEKDFVPKKKNLDEQGTEKGIMVVASINGRKKAIFTEDPRIAGTVKELMRQF